MTFPINLANILFYDGSCPVCNKEISLLRKYKDNSLTLQDIHNDDTAALSQPYTSDQLMAVLHFKTSQGAWLKGLDATVAAWCHTPFGFLLKPLRWPLISTVCDWFYYRWAANRAANKVCKISDR